MSRVLRLCILLVPLVLLAGCAIQPISPDLESATQSSVEATETAAAETAAYPIVYAAPDCDYGGAFKSFEALDVHTVKITMCAPEASLAYRLAGAQWAIQDSAYLQATGGGGDILTQPNGTGPFRLTGWGDDSATFERFDEYWGDPAASPRLVVHWTEDADAGLAALQAGEVDGVLTLAADNVPVVESDSALQLATQAPQNIWYVGINNMMPPFDNERVRQALAMAIDRDALVAEFFPDGSLVPTQVLAPQVAGYSEGEEWYPYDPEAAMAILAEEGAENLEIELTYWEAGNSDDVAQAIADQLAKVGITANVVSETEYEDYFTSLLSGEVGELDYIAWYPGIDALEWYFLFARDAGLEFGDGFPAIWEALETASTLPGVEERQPYFDQIAQLIKQHAPMVPIAHEASAVAFRADVTGTNPNLALAATPLTLLKAGDRDVFHYMLDVTPYSAYCNDEIDVGSFQICYLVGEGLIGIDPETRDVAPGLADSWETSDDLTEWTFTLRDDVTFHDGSSLDAGDVVLTYAAMWDAENPLHVGRTGSFDNWQLTFGSLLNAPEE